MSRESQDDHMTRDNGIGVAATADVVRDVGGAAQDVLRGGGSRAIGHAAMKGRELRGVDANAMGSPLSEKTVGTPVDDPDSKRNDTDEVTTQSGCTGGASGQGDANRGFVGESALASENAARFPAAEQIARASDSLADVESEIVNALVAASCLRSREHVKDVNAEREEFKNRHVLVRNDSDARASEGEHSPPTPTSRVAAAACLSKRHQQEQGSPSLGPEDAGGDIAAVTAFGNGYVSANSREGGSQDVEQWLDIVFLLYAVTLDDHLVMHCEGRGPKQLCARAAAVARKALRPHAS